MYVDDGYRWHKHEIVELYLQGKTAGIISGLTGVPKIRIQRELDRLSSKRPDILRQHLEAALYPSRRNRDIDPVMICQG